MTPRRDEEIRRAREALIARGLRLEGAPSPLVPEPIEQSWRRSVSLRVDPTAEPRVLGTVDPDAAILRAAGRILDQWRGSLEDSRLSLLLADQDGRIVSRRTVARQDERRLDRANAAEGFDFSEGALGTNGLGTPIEARDVVFVRGAEHYNEALSQLACAGAPLRHPITGRIVGSVALASPVAYAHTLMVSMVRQAGNQIAEQLAAQADSRDLELARTYRRFRTSRHPVLVMNAETVMTDLPTLSHLDAESHAVLWDRLLRRGGTEQPSMLDLPVLGTSATVRQLGRSPRDPLFVLEFTEPIRLPVDTAPGSSALGAGPDPGQPARRPSIDVRGPAGTAGPDDPARHDPEAAERTLPAPAPARSGPYAAVRLALDGAAAVAGIVRVDGAPGTGKRHQARLWLRERTGRDPLELDAGRLAGLPQDQAGLPGGDGGIAGHQAGLPADRGGSPDHEGIRGADEAGSWAAIEQALAQGRGVLVVGAHRADPASLARLESLSTAASAGAGAAAPVVLTERTPDTRGESPSSGRPGGEVSAEADDRPSPADEDSRVTVPALADLTSELPVVIREVAADLFPGAPLRFAPAALQALLAWPWPGNVAELRRILAGLPAGARSGLIEMRHLPPALRQSSGSRLSRLERSERDVIVAALRESQWNKSEAAHLLGIGRTTLYRKIRSLRIQEGE